MSDDEYEPDAEVEAVLDRHFSERRFYASEVVDRLLAEGSDAELDRVGHVLTLRTDEDGAPVFLHTTDPADDRDGWPMFFHVSLASVAELEAFADNAVIEAERLDAVAAALDRLAEARKRTALRVIK